MTVIDDLLTRALLLKDPQIPLDTVPYDDTAHDPLPWEDLSPGGLGADLADLTAASHLRSLCEVAVTRSAPAQITDFITEQLPEPRGAWILGCLLQLADAEDGARFWWQYAAGAGDTAASYCLYLHHRAIGDSRAAAFWHDQADTITDRIEESVPTFLRILEHLTPAGRHPYTDTTLAVMSYVTAAVTDGYTRHPDYEIPLPGPYFAEHIQIILAATAGATGSTHRERHPTIALPARPAPDSAATAEPLCGGRPDGERAAPPESERVLVEVAAADTASASAFREAVSACWERVTGERPGKEREAGHSCVRLRYYLDRRQLLQAFRGCRPHRPAQAS
ncbi:DUF6207 family protein [Streptomyces sp. NPDC005227]|uniref:DUF6207 family protein n=1 Tax=unclassified Streptomyces TaxID=2593676 RepID=UPI0036BC5B9D